MTVTPPSCRRDLEREIDLIEEVARIHGYDKIPEDVGVPMARSARTDEDRVLAKVRQVLTACGFDEALTISVVDDWLSTSFSPWTDAAPLALQMPILERADKLRRSLVPSLLKARRENEAAGNRTIELFETAKGLLAAPRTIAARRIDARADEFRLAARGVLPLEGRARRDSHGARARGPLRGARRRARGRARGAAPAREAAEPRLFDYKSDEFPEPHRFSETARDCKVAGDTLVLVGEAGGWHSLDPNDPYRDRLTVLEVDVVVADEGRWTVAGPGPNVQSRATAVDIDDFGRIHLGSYTCDDDCKPDGEVRVYESGGVLVSQVQLGPLGSLWLGPLDIAWSPTGYAVVAFGELQDQDSVFKVQAVAPGKPEPLWTFLPLDRQGQQLGLAAAVGPYPARSTPEV